MWPRYLMWFAHEHVDFRYAEIQSILSMFNICMKFVEKPTVEKPYWIVELPTEDCAKRIASRSVSLKSCIELWSRATTQSQLHENLKKAINNDTGKWLIAEENSDSNLCDNHVCPNDLIKACAHDNNSFKIDVETFCRHFTMKEKVEKIEQLGYLPLKGKVRLINPDVIISYYEFYGIDPNNIPEQPFDYFVGRWIADGQRDLIRQHSLKTRSFIGNTSMDAQLALLMANQARVRTGDLVLDPFVGSGSLLVAAAHFGGYVWGSDIDFMMLHARTRPTRVGEKVRKKEESIVSNMRQYGVQSRYIDVVVSDFSLSNWRQLQLDAIVTDPPYGIREPTEKIGIERDNYTLTEDQIVNHIPSKVDYGLPHLYGDLMDFAAKHLRIGGRLVCWYPFIREEYNESDLPWHPCLHLVANSEQVLSRLSARRLLTYEKLEEADVQAPRDASQTGNQFRDKYFNFNEATRRERKEKKAEELASNPYYQASKLNQSNGHR